MKNKGRERENGVSRRCAGKASGNLGAPGCRVKLVGWAWLICEYFLRLSFFWPLLTVGAGYESCQATAPFSTCRLHTCSCAASWVLETLESCGARTPVGANKFYHMVWEASSKRGLMKGLAASPHRVWCPLGTSFFLATTRSHSACRCAKFSQHVPVARSAACIFRFYAGSREPESKTFRASAGGGGRKKDAEVFPRSVIDI